MYNYKCLNAISKVGLEKFTADYAETEDMVADAILVRSAQMHEMEFDEKLLAIARAGAGVNNIPLDKCAEQGIVVFNTPGANANAVKELAIAGMLLASRDVKGAMQWVDDNKDDENISKTMEKAKSKYAGTEILGKKLGIIGLGAIGGPLGNAAVALGMDVIGCDPYLSVDAAWALSRQIQRVKTRAEVFKECDFISVHTPLIEDPDPDVNTKKMINKETLSMMKDGVVILNFARAALVDDDAMAEAIASGKVKKYITDFPTPKSANTPNVVAFPHLGASTEEAEDNCAVMAIKQVMDYIENGNIKNSVNYPALDAGICQTDARVCILHKNIPNMLTQFTGAFAAHNVNIEHMTNKSKNDYAYSILDVCAKVDEATINQLKAIEGVLKVRVIQ